MAVTELLLRSIDDYLGPAEGRFFSRGYQRAVYDVHTVAVTGARACDAGVTATADITYPADWSKKKAGVDLRPHLSTVDALVLGVQLAEAHTAHAWGLGAAERRTVRLAKVVLRAGTAPQEVLTDIPLSASLTRTGPEPDEPGLHRSVYDCSVGGLRVRCELVHPVVAEATTGVVHDSLADLLGPGEPRFYGEGFKLRRHTVSDVRVSVPELTAHGAVAFAPVAGSPAPTEGIEGARQPSVSLIDCFVVTLQLAQVLMYELDSVSRENSNTLWMMQTSLEAARTPGPLTAGDQADALPLTATTAVTAKRTLPLRGAVWRSVELSGELAGIRMRATFAHELPADAKAATA
ncbi:AvrD family protein [Streptomyces sp. NPDC048430]|uniref:AvrD family protein n=1 Tax=Streptomyces sp. NPDC048430 TaxID=3155388 RepID=UPI0034369968